MAELTTVARPYAKAAFQYALASSKLAAWSDMLSFAALVVTEASVSDALDDPTITADQRTAIMVKICGDQIDANLANFISLLAKNDRLDALPEIVELYEDLKAEEEKSVDVSITSAFELSEAQSTTLANALKKKLDRQVNIETVVDQTLIGGAIIRAGDMVIDSSVKGKLSKLAETVI